MQTIKTFEEFEHYLAEQFLNLTTQEQKFAQYLMENPSNIALKSMRELARVSGVTSYTAIRFFKKMGFETFEELKSLARSELSNKDISFFGDTVTQGELEGNKMLAAQLRLIMSVVEHPSGAELDRIAKILMSSRINYILGFRRSDPLAKHFHNCGQNAHKNMLLITGIDGQAIDQFAGIGSNDVCFVFSFKPYTQIAVRLCQFAKRRGARVVAMTDSKMSPVHRIADDNIFVPVSGPSYFNSLAAPIIVLERLLTRMHSLDSEKADLRINQQVALRRFLDY